MKSILLILLMLHAVVLSAQEYEKRVYTASRTTTPPVINGDLDDMAWTTGEWGGDFTQFEPYEGAAPKQKTEFKILYDDDNIYVALKMWDTAPDSIVARMTRRDDTDGDQVVLGIDSYYDLSTGFGFGVSAAGVKGDLIWTDDGRNEDETFDPIWYVKTGIYDWGWAAEMKIPLTQLRFAGKDEQVWGFEVIRELYRHNETDLWQPIPRNASGFIHNSGLLKGLNNIRPKKLFDLTPYGVAMLETYEGERGNPWHDGTNIKANAGIDAKIGVTNNMILSLSLNPDFGQVEADPSEVNLTAFETYFSEKRPFFIEGRNITSYNLGIGDGDEGNDNLFYSRRIGRRPSMRHSPGDDEFTWTPAFTPIIGAAKLTGKSSGGLSVGAVEAVTAQVNTRIYNELTDETSYITAEPLSNFALGRVQKDLNDGKTIIGGLITSTIRQLDETTEDYFHKSATTGGLDFTQYFGDRNYILQLRTVFSNVTGTEDVIARTQRSIIHNFRRPDADYTEYDPTRKSLTGTGGNLMAGKIGGNWQFLYLSAWKSPGLELNDIGYMQAADQYLGVGVINYNIHKPFGIFNRMNFGTNLIHLMDFGGNLNVVGISGSSSAQYKNLWHTFISGQVNSPEKDNLMLRGGPMMKMPGNMYIGGGINSNSRKKLSGEIDFRFYKTFGDVRTAYNISFEADYRPINTLTISIEPEWSRTMDNMQYVTTVSLTSGVYTPRYIFGTIDQKILSLSLRVDYNITPDLTVQYWGQPFFGSGSYSNFKHITDPVAGEFDDRYEVFSPSQIEYITGDNEYAIDENLDSWTDYSFSNPDFTVSEFLHNLVVRWEFLPGSTAYLVWSQTREYNTGDGRFDFGSQAGALFGDTKPHNVFLVKFSYRFGL
ncbi:MAG: carbohydrate binding family 9 domain-containing protein [Bacteroidales bacterium]|nr:carbohydrate binding family 9 domain-containing protein [Bacteroidales bacterium]